MHLQQIELHFDTPLERPVWLMLDASEDTWPRVRQTALDLIEALAGRVAGIAFGGNPELHRVGLPGDFERKAQPLFHKNRARPLLLNPVAENLLLKEPGSCLVVISGSSPIDLDDWLQRPEQYPGPHITLLNLSGTHFQKELPEIAANINVGAIVDMISNPPSRAVVQGPGLFPLAASLSQGEALLECNDQEIRLVIEDLNPALRLSIKIKALCMEKPKLFIEQENGGRIAVSASSLSSWFSEPLWHPLNKNTAKVIEAGIGKRDFACPHCGESHGYNTTFCPLGEYLLQDIPFGCTVLLRDGCFIPLTDELLAWPFEHGQKVVVRDGSIYQWDGTAWKYLEKIEPYQDIGQGIHALFVES